ncbi:MAG TPA: tRNA (adenine-N1)-methyltransferase, partial [Bacillota bacterium]
MNAPHPSAEQLHRLPLREGEPVVLIDDRGRRYVFELQAGKVFQTHRIGLVPHDRLLGQPPGLRFSSDRGVSVVCLRPSWEETITNLRRRTQIIYPKDLGLILIRGDIYPGARVLEAGIGSGASALLFLRYLG